MFLRERRHFLLRLWTQTRIRNIVKLNHTHEPDTSVLARTLTDLPPPPTTHQQRLRRGQVLTGPPSSPTSAVCSMSQGFWGTSSPSRPPETSRLRAQSPALRAWTSPCAPPPPRPHTLTPLLTHSAAPRSRMVPLLPTTVPSLTTANTDTRLQAHVRLPRRCPPTTPLTPSEYPERLAALCHSLDLPSRWLRAPQQRRLSNTSPVYPEPSPEHISETPAKCVKSPTPRSRGHLVRDRAGETAGPLGRGEERAPSQHAQLTGRPL